MRLTVTILAATLALSAVPAFANHKGACKEYMQACKDDATVTGAANKKDKWKAMKACVTDKATAAGDKGKACLDAQAAHKAEKQDK